MYAASCPHYFTENSLQIISLARIGITIMFNLILHSFLMFESTSMNEHKIHKAKSSVDGAVHLSKFDEPPLKKEKSKIN